MRTKNKTMDNLNINDKMKVCSICYEKFIGYGNNAEPVNRGRCCNRCNYIVIYARLNYAKLIKKRKENK